MNEYSMWAVVALCLTAALGLLMYLSSTEEQIKFKAVTTSGLVECPIAKNDFRTYWTKPESCKNN